MTEIILTITITLPDPKPPAPDGTDKPEPFFTKEQPPVCRWFRAAVLPLDKELETALLYRLDAKRCAVCGALFRPGSNRAKYCPDCAAAMKRIRAAGRKRKQRAKCHPLGAEKPL